MRDNHVKYSDGLSFHIGDSVADIGVKALYDLHEGEMIATIPKQACLTILTTEAEALLSEAELGGGLGLAVALMYERSIGELSKWSGYLRLLPFQQYLPFVWSLPEIDRLLTGTELHKVRVEENPCLFCTINVGLECSMADLLRDIYQSEVRSYACVPQCRYVFRIQQKTYPQCALLSRVILCRGGNSLP